MGRVAFLSGTIFILAALTTPLGRCRWSCGMPKTFFLFDHQRLDTRHCRAGYECWEACPWLML